MKRLIIAAILGIVAALGAAAQGRIDKLINQFEKHKEVETTYTERRTAKKKKLYRITIVLTFQNEGMYNRLANAFEEERPNTINATKTRNQRSYRFSDDKGTSTYTLVNDGGSYTLVKNWQDTSVDDNSGVDIDIEFLESDLYSFRW